MEDISQRSMQMTLPWTEQDTQDLLTLLNRLPNHKPLPIFLWFCAHVMGVSVEAIFYRIVNGNKQVLLQRRPPKDKDPVYANLLAVMGTMIQATDILPPDDPELLTNWYREVFKRILAEAGLTKFGALPRNITSRLYPGDRGPICQQIFLCTVPDDEEPAFLKEKNVGGLTRGGWYDIDDLPIDIVGEHVSLIQLAAQYM